MHKKTTPTLHIIAKVKGTKQMVSRRSSGSQTTERRDRNHHLEVVTELRNAKDAVMSSGARFQMYFLRDAAATAAAAQ